MAEVTEAEGMNWEISDIRPAMDPFATYHYVNAFRFWQGDCMTSDQMYDLQRKVYGWQNVPPHPSVVREMKERIQKPMWHVVNGHWVRSMVEKSVDELAEDFRRQAEREERERAAKDYERGLDVLRKYVQDHMKPEGNA